MFVILDPSGTSHNNFSHAPDYSPSHTKYLCKQRLFMYVRFHTPHKTKTFIYFQNTFNTPDYTQINTFKKLINSSRYHPSWKSSQTPKVYEVPRLASSWGPCTQGGHRTGTSKYLSCCIIIACFLFWLPC